MRVQMAAWNPHWQTAFKSERRLILAALDDLALQLHHIGSTSVQGLWAKPIIDMLLEVRELTRLDHQSPALETLGYEACGEFGISGRRYFRKCNAHGDRSHQIHAFAFGSPHIERHIAFRDYLRSHAEVAQRYAELKRSLAGQHPSNIHAYMDGKDPFIKQYEQIALVWYRGQQSQVSQ